MHPRHRRERDGIIPVRKVCEKLISYKEEERAKSSYQPGDEMGSFLLESRRRWVTIQLSCIHNEPALAEITLSGFEILTGFNKEAFLYKRTIAEKEIITYFRIALKMLVVKAFSS